MTINELRKDIITRLTEAVGQGEATAMMRLMMHDALGMSPVDIAIFGERSLEDSTIKRLHTQCQRILDGEPIQYVLGYANFHGLELKVSPAVLIPRPETAELVDLICDNATDAADLNIADLCTGSGCIALALGRELRFPHLTAVDISPEALAVAEQNARLLGVDVKFVETDVLTLAPPPMAAYDIIVSNPPYIADAERAQMDARVFDHEPSQALFVPDADPLRFYRAISLFARKALRSEGGLYFEINPLFAADLQLMLEQHGWGHIEILRDFRGLNRFALCRH